MVVARPRVLIGVVAGAALLFAPAVSADNSAAARLQPQNAGLSPVETLPAMLSRDPEIDLNGDGKIDLWREFNPDGSVSRVSYDNVGDGKPDETVVYKKSQVVRTWSETGKTVPDRRFTQWMNDGGAIERTQLEERRDGEWVVVKRTRTIAGKDLIEVRESANGKERVTYERATAN